MAVRRFKIKHLLSDDVRARSSFGAFIELQILVYKILSYYTFEKRHFPLLILPLLVDFVVSRHKVLH